MELAGGEVEQDGLSTVPVHPREQVVQAKQCKHGDGAEAGKTPFYFARINLVMLGVVAFGRGCVVGVGHFGSSVGLRSVEARYSVMLLALAEMPQKKKKPNP